MFPTARARVRGDAGSSRGVRFHGPRLQPGWNYRSLLQTYQSNSLQGWDDAFCLVQFKLLTLQEKKKKKKSYESNFSSFFQRQNWLNSAQPKCQITLLTMSLPSASCNPFTGYSTHTVIYWPAALAPAIRPPHSLRLCFASLSRRYHRFSHQSCLPSWGLSSRTLTM